MKKYLLPIALVFSFINIVPAQTKRYVKVIASGTGDGSSWTNASANLQAMIDASAPNDQVWIAKGTYKPTKTVGYTSGHVALADPRFKSFDLSNGVKLYGGFNGNESTMGQRKPINKTILSGDFLGNDVGFTNNSENAYHVVFSANHNTVITLDGLTITGGNTNGQPQAFTNISPSYSEITADGGALYSYEAGSLVQNCVFINNNSSHYGGAIYAYVLGGDYNGCLFLNNKALDGAAAYTQNFPNVLYSHFVNCTMFGNISNAAICKASLDDNTYIYNTIIWGNTVTGLSAGTYYVYNSDVQNAFASGTRADAATTVAADPVFTNSSDIDGADNILGTLDDGLIPQCGPTIGGGTNTVVTFTKDFTNGTRIINGNVDMGIYETSLSQAINSLTILSLSNHATIENLPAGLCEGKTANFAAQTGGNGGVFQWTQNGNVVGTNSPNLSINNFHIGDQLQLKLTNPANTCGPGGIVQSNIITLANVSAGAPVIPSNIIGPTNACPYFNGTPVAYKINKAPGGVKYHWYVGSGASGVNIVSHPNGGGVNDTIVMVTFDASWTSASGVRYLYVTAENWCGVSGAKKIQLKQNVPQTPGAITGPMDPCPYMPSASNPSGTQVTYSISKVTDAAFYTWTVPAGVTIDSHPGGTGENDTAIVVSFSAGFVSGTLSVLASNYCGAKTARSANLTKRASGTPGMITGSVYGCSYKQSPSNPSGTPVEYTIRKVLYATSYTWTAPASATVTHPNGPGINDTIIRVIYNSSYNGGVITVKSNTNCNTSAVRSLTLYYQLPNSVPYLSASLPTECPQRRVTFSVLVWPYYSTGIRWIIPPSGTVISYGTFTVEVEFDGTTSISDTVGVIGFNDCGESQTVRKIRVPLFNTACRPSTAKPGGENNPSVISRSTVAENTATFDVAAMPNPSRGDFNLSFSGTDYNSPLSLQINDATGRPIENKKYDYSGRSINIGGNYAPGIYFLTVIQGTNRKTIRLVKL